MKLLSALLFLSFILNAASVDKKIEKTTSAINDKKSEYSSVSSKLDETAKEIIKQKMQLDQLQIKLKDLETQLATKESTYKSSIAELASLTSTQTTLQKNQDDIQQKLIFNIARMASLTMLMDKKEPSNIDSIMSAEVIKLLAKQTDSGIKDLNEKFFKNSQYIADLQQKSKTLKDEIATIDLQRKDVTQTKRQSEKDLAVLDDNKQKYKTALANILKQQDALKQTLSDLNIVKIDEAKHKAEQQAQADAMNEKNANYENDNNANNEKIDTSSSQDTSVKKVGSSYKSVNTVRYTGPKTIAPLEQYTVSKRYGNYTDPIYKIKIFNESVSLATRETGAKVRNVFNGKVIFAKNTPLLDNVVIIEHDNGLHTIYANLSQIAPNIRKGAKVAKSSVIGRVNNELVFEVTQRDSHIDPLELF